MWFIRHRITSTDLQPRQAVRIELFRTRPSESHLQLPKPPSNINQSNHEQHQLHPHQATPNGNKIQIQHHLLQEHTRRKTEPEQLK